MTRARDLADSADKDISGTVTLDDIVLSNDMTVADNGKVIFGAGSDLEIYHDGNSKIADVGDGKLELHSNGTGVFIQKGATEYMGKFETDGAVTLYYDNAAKLATTSTGVDVEGNLIAKGYFASEATNSTNKWLAYTYTDNTFRINYNGAGADELTLTSDGDLGIGTSSITSTASNRTILELNGTSTSLFNMSIGGTRKAYIYHDDASFYISNMDNTPMQFHTSNTERMRILAGGGLTFNGDTAAANALDDYEEGYYDVTANLSGGGSVTFDSSHNRAFYTKIGNLVTTGARLEVGSVSSPSGHIYLSLPFTPNFATESSGLNIAAAVIYNPSSDLSGHLVAEVTNSYSGSIIIRQNGGVASGVTTLGNLIDSGSLISFTLSYHVA